MPLHCTPYEQQRYPLHQLQFWIDQHSSPNELPLQFPGVHPTSRVVEHREGLVFKDVIPDAKLPPLCLRHAPFGQPMCAQPLAPPWFYRVIKHTTMILRELEITDPNAQVEKGMATSFPPCGGFAPRTSPHRVRLIRFYRSMWLVLLSPTLWTFTSSWFILRTVSYT